MLKLKKKKKIEQENVRLKVGRRKALFLFSYICLRKALLIKPTGEPNSLPKPNC